jgi:ribosomal protein S11
MIQNYNFNFNLNKFFKKLFLKKRYIKKLTKKTLLLKRIKEQNYKKLSDDLFLKNKQLVKHKSLISYIITISFSRSNTTIHVMDFSGVLRFYCSAGNLFFSGKNKTARVSILKAMTRILSQKLKILQNKPIALHLKNVGFRKF